MKPRAPVGVFLAREVYDLYSCLREGDDFKRVIDKGLSVLKGDVFAGEKVRKRQIPKYYIDRYGVNNLYRLRLDKTRRCCYSIVADEEGVKVVVLEVFSDHKSYDRRFGYKTS